MLRSASVTSDRAQVHRWPGSASGRSPAPIGKSQCRGTIVAQNGRQTVPSHRFSAFSPSDGAVITVSDGETVIGLLFLTFMQGTFGTVDPFGKRYDCAIRLPHFKASTTKTASLEDKGAISLIEVVRGLPYLRRLQGPDDESSVIRSPCGRQHAHPESSKASRRI